MHRASVQAMYFSLIKCHLEHGVDLELGCCAVRIHRSLYARIHVNRQRSHSLYIGHYNANVQ
jgi:hypothetical protein